MDLENYTINLKPRAKRSNRTVFIDEECALVLQKWLKVRKQYNPKCNALFVNTRGNRINRNDVYYTIVKWATYVGLHNPDSDNPEDHFTPHNFRHWFTTWLLRNGMPREYVKELRGDARKEAIDIYHRIDPEDLKREYLRCIPKLGIII